MAPASGNHKSHTSIIALPHFRNWEPANYLLCNESLALSIASAPVSPALSIASSSLTGSSDLSGVRSPVQYRARDSCVPMNGTFEATGLLSIASP